MPGRDLIPTDSILYNSRIIGSLIQKEFQSSPSSGFSTKEWSGFGGMGRTREIKVPGMGTALPSCSCVALDPVFPDLTSKNKTEIWISSCSCENFFIFWQLSNNSVTKLPYHLPLPSTLSSTTHTHTENQKPLCRSHKCLWFPFTLSVAILMPLVWSNCLLSKMRKWRPRKEKWLNQGHIIRLPSTISYEKLTDHSF